MGYNFDVFISYKRCDLFNGWVHDIFEPLFRELLEEELADVKPEGVKLYIDKNISGGVAWQKDIKKALATSRCLVPLWSPRYFKSEWCRYELAVIINRQKRLGYHTIEFPNGLIIPFTINDGERFPAVINEIEYFDCSMFAYSTKAFKDSIKYIEFRSKMYDWVNIVANAIKKSPNWDPLWLEPEWLDIPIDVHVPPYNDVIENNPSMG